MCVWALCFFFPFLSGSHEYINIHVITFRGLFDEGGREEEEEGGMLTHTHKGWRGNGFGWNERKEDEQQEQQQQLQQAICTQRVSLSSFTSPFYQEGGRQREIGRLHTTTTTTPSGEQKR